MKTYKIFEHPIGKIECVKQGWSWPAFCFGAIWALVKRMWILGGVYFASFFILGFIGGITGGEVEKAIDVITGIGGLVLAIVFGVNGNSWREKNLNSRGYEFKTSVDASNNDNAMAVYARIKQA